MKREKAEKLSQNNPKLVDYSKRICEIRSILCEDNNKVFAQKLGVSTAYASSLCNAKEPITERTLQKILKIFPEVSQSWLYFGEGNILSSAVATSTNNVPGTQSIESLTEENNFLRKTNTLLTEHIELLKKELEQVRHELHEKINEARQLRSELEKKKHRLVVGPHGLYVMHHLEHIPFSPR